MRERTVKRYLCDHCSRGFWKRDRAGWHENTCALNLDRHCSLCRFHELDFTPAPLLDLVMEATYDTDDVMRASSGCPLCTLATIMRGNKGVSREDRLEFDYKAELAKFNAAREPETEETAW